MNYYDFTIDAKRPCDRLLVMGRRGTGKSTAVKRWIADGHTAVYVVATQKQAAAFARRFVHPNTAHILPQVEECEAEYKFGSGAFAVASWSDILNIRDTSLSVAGTVPEVIIHDEAIRVDGRYKQSAPELLDDLAGTLGRSGTPPKVVVVGNPLNNINPYSTHWRLNCLAEGEYRHAGKVSVVVGTAECRDCFGRRIGIDATAAGGYVPHLSHGGVVVTVEERGLRLRVVGNILYVGVADPGGECFIRDARYTSAFYTTGGTNFIYKCRQAYYDGRVAFDSFDAELDFYLLTNVR